MKLHLPTALLSALLALGSVSHADTLLAEGVDVAWENGKPELQDSTTRFFDSGKGAYWLYYNQKEDNTWGYFQPYLGAKELFNTNGGFSFLGELYDDIPEQYQGKQTYFDYKAFDNLTLDNNMCWAYTASNIIQHWQGYYGVFSNKASELPHGYTYEEEYVATLAGTQSLNVSEAFRKSWSNGGGFFTMAAGWWLKGDDTGASGSGSAIAVLENKDSGGYFSNFYVSDTAYTQHTYAEWISQSDPETVVSSYLLDGLGYSKQSDKWVQEVKGQLVAIGVYNSSVGAHALTCYGVDVDANGKVTALHLTNSDDVEYRLFTVNVEEKDGNIYLYNQDGTEWSFGGYVSGWYIEDITSINTTDDLVSMRQDYDTNDLVWTGESGTWLNEAGKEATALPTETSGWGVAVNTHGTHEGKTYASYYSNGRDAVFDDTAFADGTYDGTVELGGNVDVNSLSISNSAGAYSFSGAHTVTAVTLDKEGSAQASFTNTKLVVGTATVKSGELALAGSASMEATTLTVDESWSGSGNALSLSDTSSVSAGSVALEGGTVSLSDTSSLTSTGAVTVSGASLSLTNTGAASGYNLSADSLSVSGTGAVSLSGAAKMNVTNALTVDGAGNGTTGPLSLSGTSSVSAGSVALEGGTVSLSGAAKMSVSSFEMSGGKVSMANDAALYVQPALGTGVMTVSGGQLEMLNSADVYADSVIVKESGVVSMNATAMLRVYDSLEFKMGDVAATRMTPKGEVNIYGNSASIIALAFVGVDAQGGYVKGISETSKAYLMNALFTVAKDTNFTMENALLHSSYDAAVLGADEGASLTVKNTEIVFSEGNTDVITTRVLNAGGRLTRVEVDDVIERSASTEPVELTSNAKVLAVSSSVLSDLTVTGESLTLNFSTLEGWNTTDYDFLAISFDGTSFDFSEGLELAVMVDKAAFAYENVYYATTQSKMRAAGSPAMTLYFSTAGGEGLLVSAIPEPTTATLSLLALAALAARRRRR